MAYDGYDCLKVRVDNGVAFVTIDHPPINLFDMPLIAEMNTVGLELEADDSVRVVVIDSANPDFFIAHADVELILTMPTEVPPKADTLGPFHEMVDRFRTMPKATIAKIEGLCRGGGSELVGRALEVILGCEDFPADLAERYGYINRALAPEELTPFVEKLAYRIASFPAEAIALAKAAASGAEPPVEQGLIDEAHYFNQSVALPEARRRMALFMELGGQTREVELGMTSLGDKLAEGE